MTKDFSYQFYDTTVAAWDAMYQAILGARQSIFWEVYIFRDDEAGARFIDVLCEKAGAGLKVIMIIDALGMRLSEKSLSRLRLSGVKIVVYNQLYPEWQLYKWWRRIWFRNHRKVLIVDEEVAFLGGVNITDAAREWKDLHIRITGRVVRPLLRSFAKSYVRDGGERSDVRHLLHPRLLSDWKEWRKHIRYIWHSPFFNKYSSGRKVFYRALAIAKNSVNLLSPYYAPDRKFLKLLTMARKRGVEVNIFLPMRTDYSLLNYIARSYYDLTLKAGANIHLIKGMHHGKALSIDNKFGLVGSQNLTPRSLNLNEEAGVYFSETDMVNDLNSIFADLKKDAEVVQSDQWQKRGRWNRIKEWLASKLRDFV